MHVIAKGVDRGHPAADAQWRSQDDEVASTVCSSVDVGVVRWRGSLRDSCQLFDLLISILCRDLYWNYTSIIEQLEVHRRLFSRASDLQTRTGRAGCRLGKE